MARAKIDVPPDRIAAFFRKNHIRRLALFGSVLMDHFRPDSDAHVLVDFDSDAEIGFLALGRMRRKLSDLLEQPVDLVLQDGLKPRLRHSIVSSAEIVYAA
jgi:hypothetical protein